MEVELQQPDAGQLKIDRPAPIVDHGALFEFGNALSRGLTLSGKLDAARLEHHAAGAIGDTAGGLAVQTALGTAGRTGQMAGAALTAASTGLKMRDIWLVGSGRASPETIRHIIPHAVMAWEALRGPINLPSQDFRVTFRGTYQEPGMRMQTSGYVTGTRTFSSRAPRALAAFGWHPYTDSMVQTYRSYAETRTVMNGRDWQLHLNSLQGVRGLSPTSTSNFMLWQSYTKLTPAGTYTPMGPMRISRIAPSSTIGTMPHWTTTPPSTWQQMPTYTPPPPTYTPPMRTYTPPPPIPPPPPIHRW
jgi:hypothetical protein